MELGILAGLAYFGNKINNLKQKRKINIEDNGKCLCKTCEDLSLPQSSSTLFVVCGYDPDSKNYI